MTVTVMFGQVKYRSVDEVREEWQDYTSFQKQELVSFSNFLFSEGFYERALLGYFQYLYKYPGDPLEFAAYYKIAQSYEFMGKPDLALNYYQRIIDKAEPNSYEAQAADYKITYLSLKANDFENVLNRTAGSEDPYDMVFRGYVHMHQLEWIPARQSFKSAEAAFDHRHYSKLIRPMYKAINKAINAPLKKRMPALLSSLVPGGGHVYLRQFENAVGSAASSLLLYTALLTLPKVTQSGNLEFEEITQKSLPLNNTHGLSGSASTTGTYSMPNPLSLKLARRKLLVPPAMLALGLYAGSIWKTIHDIDTANRKLVERFIGKVSDRLPVDRFMDFTEPEFILR